VSGCCRGRDAGYVAAGDVGNFGGSKGADGGVARSGHDLGSGAGVERDAARFLAWLRGIDRRWLIVLDDLETPQDLDHLWPPSTRTGRTIVTTRRGDAALSYRD
jgi:hypothetical protein